MGKEDNLFHYGKIFQHKVISLLFTKKLFLQQISDILKPSFFDSDASQWIIEKIVEYYNKYKESPTIPSFEIDVKGIPSDVLKLAVIEELKESIRYIDSSDLEYVEDKILEFCKNQCMKNAVLDSVELVQSGQYDEVKVLIDNAMNAGATKEIGYEYEKDVKARYTEDIRYTIPTGFEVVDDLMAGGLGGSELGVVVAPPGIGKSWLLAAIGANALKAGKTVVHYTLELKAAYVGKRYDAIHTGIQVQDLEYHIPEIEKAVKNIPGRLIIQHYGTKSITVNGLTAHLELLKIQGIDPDLVILDYGDLVKTVSKNGPDKHYLDLEGLYEDFRAMAQHFDIPVWTASQAGRSASEENEIEADKIAGSYGKIMVADFVMSLQRKREDKAGNTGRGFIIKNRFGADGLALPASVNTGNGQFEFYAPSSSEGQNVKAKQNDGANVIKGELFEKFKEFRKG